ncbi:MAG TPA: DUF2520 domain-containing protein [Verrucomicrobiae bacterium]|nr:DUF2520 domain-containing protein [Verrucomicrobiae bacterium]
MAETETNRGGRGVRRERCTPSVTVGVVGAGRAGTVIALALERAGYELVALSSRRRPDAAELASRLGRPAVAVDDAVDVLDRATVVWLTVPDDELAPLAIRLGRHRDRWGRRVAIHCAGRFDRSVLAPLRLTGAGVAACHPLAALARPDPDQLRGVVAPLDADPGARRGVVAMARRIGLCPIPLPGDQRAAYHAVAVMAGNLPLVLLGAAERVGAEAGLPAEIVRGLLPLLAGALANARVMGTRDALTGPAVRGDRRTLAAHLAVLEALDPKVAELYRAASALAAPPPVAGAA